MVIESTQFDEVTSKYMALDSGTLKTLIRNGMLLMTLEERKRFVCALETEMNRFGSTMRSYLVPLGIFGRDAGDLTANEVGHLIRFLKIINPGLMPTVERVLSEYSAFFDEPESPPPAKRRGGRFSAQS
jgi:hypothetical protein